MPSDIFISYRRADSAPWAGRLYDTLGAHFGEDHIFMDVDKLAPGADFAAVIDAALDSSSALVAIIGPGWAQRGGSRHRLDDASDFVRREIEGALRRAIPVIPVLVGGATPPTATDLPGPLAELANKQAISLRDARWKADVTPRVTVLEAVAQPRPAPFGSPARSEQRGRPALEKLGAKFRGLLGETNIALQGGHASATALRSLDELARSRLGELAPVANLLERLGSHLTADELVLDLAAAVSGWTKFGLLTLTDRRVIFVGTRLKLADLFFEVPFGRIEAVDRSFQWDTARISFRVAPERFRSPQLLEVDVSWQDSKPLADRIAEASCLTDKQPDRSRTVTDPSTERLIRLSGAQPGWKWEGLAESAQTEVLPLAREALTAIGARDIRSVDSISLGVTGRAILGAGSDVKIYCEAYAKTTADLRILSRAAGSNLVDFGSSEKNIRRVLEFFKQRCKLTAAE